jgi:uncharacterized ParB-like nuclease family protein
MKLEFHQLNRRYEHLRVRHPGQQRRLIASLAASGQQTPIVVVAISDTPDGYLVIDGYKRIAALEQLGRDTVEAVIWPMNESDALEVLRNLPIREKVIICHKSNLSTGWMELESWPLMMSQARPNF